MIYNVLNVSSKDFSFFIFVVLHRKPLGQTTKNVKKQPRRFSTENRGLGYTGCSLTHGPKFDIRYSDSKEKNIFKNNEMSKNASFLRYGTLKFT